MRVIEAAAVFSVTEEDESRRIRNWASDVVWPVRESVFGLRGMQMSCVSSRVSIILGQT